MSDLAEGLALYAAARYFDAHEAWEYVWMREPAGERFFVQALIHYAVALHHHGLGNALGADLQMTKGVRKLAGYLPFHRGIDTWTAYREGIAWLTHRGPAPRWIESNS